MKTFDKVTLVKLINKYCTHDGLEIELDTLPETEVLYCTHVDNSNTNAYHYYPDGTYSIITEHDEMIVKWSIPETVSKYDNSIERRAEMEAMDLQIEMDQEEYYRTANKHWEHERKFRMSREQQLEEYNKEEL